MQRSAIRNDYIVFLNEHQDNGSLEDGTIAFLQDIEGSNA